jgi:hypothetical protein
MPIFMPIFMQLFATFFHREKVELIKTKYCLGYFLGDFLRIYLVTVANLNLAKK